MAFTYLLTFKPTGQKYFGVRYASNSNPDDLWTKYFSSSKIVKELVRKHGKDSFEYRIDRIFEEPIAALEHELAFLKNIEDRENWLNQSFGSGGHNHARIKTEEHRRKIGEGRKRGNSAKSRAANQRNSVLGIAARTGMKDSEETKRRRNSAVSATLKGRPQPYLKNRYLICGKEYIGIDAAAAGTGTSRYLVRSRCSSHDQKWENWRLIKGRANTP